MWRGRYVALPVHVGPAPAGRERDAEPDGASLGTEGSRG